MKSVSLYPYSVFCYSATYSSMCAQEEKEKKSGQRDSLPSDVTGHIEQ